MPYIGNPIYQSAFVVDQFSGNGSTTAFTMSVAPAGVTNVLVAVSGVLQDPSTYGVVGNTITFSAAPPSGTGNISCRYLGVPVTGVTTTAYRTVTEFTATASQTTFTPPSYTVGFINVYLNGVLLGSADYTATNGTTVVLATGAAAGNLVTVESFQISSVANAIPNAAGAVSSSNIVDGAVTPAKLSTGGPAWNSSSQVSIGTSSPSYNLSVIGNANADQGIKVQNTNSGGTAYSEIWIGSNTNANQTAIFVPSSGNSNWGGAGSLNLYTASATPITFNTNATERMRISGTGIVTMPYQPVFHAQKNNGTQTGTVVISFNVALTNVGSYYSTGTNRFTAPVAGTYHFYASILDDGGSPTHSGPRFGIRKNGTMVQMNQNFYNNTSAFYDFAHVSLTITLAAGDYTEVFNDNGGPVYGGDTQFGYFGGWLIG